MADGIDGAAHLGALDAELPTVAVIGTGPDRVYPSQAPWAGQAYRCSAARWSASFRRGRRPVATTFPAAIACISGLSLGTLVVEAGLQSGSLITARLAAEQGREVFALPGSIHNPLAQGCHRLIRDGARLVEGASEIVEALAPAAICDWAASWPADSISSQVETGRSAVVGGSRQPACAKCPWSWADSAG